MRGDSVAKMLGALEDYYGKKYTDVQRRVLVQNLGDLPYEYTLDLYKVVVNQHAPTQLRALPDLPRFRECQGELNPSATYGRPALPDPDDLELTYDPELDAELRAAVEQKAQADGERNHEERQRIRGKVSKGEASAAEAYWIRVIDEFGGDWRRAHAAIGDTLDAR